MPIVLCRIDERLIHGQVVVGWGTRLHPERIVVVDDELSTSLWEQELYGMGLPTKLATEFVDVATARQRLGGWRAGSERVVLLTRDVATMVRLAEGRLLEGAEVNLGGIHHAAGRQFVLPYVYLSAEERTQLQELEGEGVAISALDVPSGRRVDLAQLLDRS
jgi:mannose/fructose/N-acetylgalactosamine-specific phosphotransferase system component IIB